jgi:hypothetical protein
MPGSRISRVLLRENGGGSPLYYILGKMEFRVSRVGFDIRVLQDSSQEDAQ